METALLIISILLIVIVLLQSAKAEFIRDLNKCAMEYQAQGLGTYESCREDIVRALVMELRK